ncbi:putative serine/threonine-protein kinase [Oppia nitens]|uniref:putative serine/threonine-protein kinase n=1 Tax=Oppia nitens TaxID=1686743 RepID=UPI0023D9E056|nr:putative serine/threonine-protein kinase [Oppia nitens]
MEYCSGTLKELINLKTTLCGRQLGEPMNILEYYMTAMIFQALLKAVQYIHELEPCIIHRDLKPDNILIELNGIDFSYIKLCDFGLATVHQRTDANSYVYNYHSDCVGTKSYSAPELYTNNHDYDHRIDIYSLSIIGAELFEFNEFPNPPEQLSYYGEARDKVMQLYLTLCQMNDPIPSERPECSQVLQDYGNWNFSKDYVKDRAVPFDQLVKKLIPKLHPNQSDQEQLLERAHIDRDINLSVTIFLIVSDTSNTKDGKIKYT